MSPQLFDFAVTDITGAPYALGQHVGKVVLVVNTASACGLTPQLAGLQQLHTRFAAQGLVVLGFPCNQFAGQDAGSHSEIAAFCLRNYGVDFPMMAKVQVNGRETAPVFAWLKQQAPGVLGTRLIKWNFTKFLVGRDGRVLRRYAPRVLPESMAPDIAAALAHPAAHNA